MTTHTTLASAIARANAALDWIEARQGPLPADGYARIETSVGVVRALAGRGLGDMTDETLGIAIAEARRFLDRAQALQKCRRPLTAAEKAARERDIFSQKRSQHSEYGCIESAAVRRASMDLTRALARVRAS